MTALGLMMVIEQPSLYWLCTKTTKDQDLWDYTLVEMESRCTLTKSWVSSWILKVILAYLWAKISLFEFLVTAVELMVNKTAQPLVAYITNGFQNYDMFC